MKAIVHKHFTKLQAITSGDENDKMKKRFSLSIKKYLPAKGATSRHHVIKFNQWFYLNMSATESRISVCLRVT